MVRNACDPRRSDGRAKRWRAVIALLNISARAITTRGDARRRARPRPDATLVDVTHDVEPQDVLGGALELAAAFKYFPPGTIFLAVVDPGVGSSRRGIAAEAGGYKFVAPDNGLLTMVFREVLPKRVVELTERRYARPTVSRTFEGRDRSRPPACSPRVSISRRSPPLTAWHVLDIPERRVPRGGSREKCARRSLRQLVPTSIGACSIASRA